VAKRITRQETIQDDVFKNAIESANEFLKVMKELRQELRESVKESQKSLQGTSFGRTDDLKKLQAERDKLIKQQVQIQKIEQEEIRTKKELEKLNREQIRTQQLIERERQKNIRQQEREAKKQKDLNNSYTRASRNLTELRKRYKDLAIQNKENTKEGRALLKELTALDIKLKSIDKKVGVSTRFVGNYERAFKGLGSGVGKFAGGLGLAVGGVAGFSTAIRESFRLFSEFELTLSKVQAVSGASSEEFSKLRAQAQELGSTTQFTASNVAELQLNLSKLGFTASQIQASTDAILDFAIATDSDLGRSAEVVASTLNAYNLEASEAARVSDVAAKAFSSTALDIEKFATAIAIVGPAAEASGVSIEETTAILGKIVDAGVDASTAGSALRNIFIDIADKGITLEEALTEISESQDKLTKANELFGKRGAVVAKIVADNVDQIGDLTQSFNNAQGAASDAARTIGDNLVGDVKRLQSAVEGAILNNEALNDTFRGIIRGATRTVNALFGAARTYEDYTNTQLGVVASTKESIDTNNELVSTYENLSSKTELTADEKVELDRVTNDLIFTFGSSVASINKETGALELNIQAVKDKIQADILLQEESVRGLIKQRATLEATLRQAARFPEELERTQNAFQQAGFFATEYFDAIRSGNTALAGVRLRQLQTSDDVISNSEAQDKLNNLIRVYGNRLQASSFALERKASVEREIAQIDQELLDLGIDLNKVAEDQIKNLRVSTESYERLGEKTQAQAGSIAALRDELSELKKEREDLQVEDEKSIETKNKEIDAINEQIRALEDLGRAQEESNEFKNLEEKIRQDALRREIEIQNDRRDALKKIAEDETLSAKQRAQAIVEVNEKAQDEITQNQIEELEARISNAEDFGEKPLEMEKRLLDLRLKLIQDNLNKQVSEESKAAKKRADIIRKNAELASAISASITRKQLENVDARIQAGQEEVDIQKSLAQQGDAAAVESLQRERKRQQERLAQRERIAARQRRVEAIIAGVRVYAAKVEDGDSNAVGSTIRDAQTLIAALSQLKDGTTFVDSSSATKILPSGSDAYISRLDYGEGVVKAKTNKRFGGDSYENVADIYESFKTGLLVPLNDPSSINKVAQVTQKYDDRLAREVSAGMKNLLREVKNGNAKTMDWEPMEKMMREIVRQGNQKLIKEYKLRKR